MNKMRTLPLLSACLLSCCVLLPGCGGARSNEGRGDEAVRVKELTAGGSAAQGGYDYSGTVEEESSASLSFTMGGTVTQLCVKVGDRVRRGQLIAAVDPASVRSSYDMARAARVQAEDACGRLKQLHDKGSLPDMKWVEAQSRLSQAVSAEAIAKKNLADCRLYAPSDGVVTEKYAETGQNAAPGMPVVKVAATGALNVRVSVPEGEMAGVRLRQQAVVAVPAAGGRTYRGTVVEKGVVADPVSRSYSVKIRLAGHDEALLPGMVAKVSLDGAAAERTGGDAVVIPARLLQLGDNNEFFLWVDRNGRAARQTVSCGEFTAGGVVITGGLKAGDRVICEGQQKVCNGTKVTTRR